MQTVTCLSSRLARLCSVSLWSETRLVFTISEMVSVLVKTTGKMVIRIHGFLQLTSPSERAISMFGISIGQDWSKFPKVRNQDEVNSLWLRRCQDKESKLVLGEVTNFVCRQGQKPFFMHCAISLSQICN